MTAAPFALARGPFVVGVAPFCGGLLRFDCRRADGTTIPLLRPASEAAQAAQDPLGLACFPLVPFSNRVSDGRFVFEGEEIVLPANFPPEPHAIHGQGWQRPWRVEARDEGSAELVLDERTAGTPFDYRARQTLSLTEEGLAVELAIENRGTGPMPAGLGLHPYFRRTPDVRLRTGAAGVWRNDARKLPERRVPLPPAWNFPLDVPLDPLRADHCLAEWSGEARITWPADRLSLVMRAGETARHAVLYVPPDPDHFCLEPVSHQTDAFARLNDPAFAADVVVLKPGERFAMAIAFEVEDHARAA